MYFVVIIALFMLLWKVVVMCPTILHKTIKNFHNVKPMLIIGHRGSRCEGLPENTLASFKDAVDAGVDVLELDVWLSADNEVVVFHDKSFERMTGGQCLGIITETKYEDFPTIIPPIDQNNRCELYSTYEWSRIPLLEEVLFATPTSVRINIEFKQDSDLLISKVLELIIKHNRLTSVFWFSLVETINKKLRLANKNIPNIISVMGLLRILALYYSGILPFVAIPEDVFGITVEEITLEDIRHDAATSALPLWIQKILAYIFQGRPPRVMVAPGLFRYLKRRGLSIWFLGVLTEQDLYLAYESGATGILTDRPRWVMDKIRYRK